MSEILHLAAVAPAGVAACCAASGRWIGQRRVRAIEIAVALLMLAAMIDVSRAAFLLAPVLWAALLLAGALVLASATRSRPAGGNEASPRPLVHGPIHGALGCIAMAALVMVMATPDTSAATPSHHSMSASVLTVAIVAGVLSYGVYSIAVLRRGRLRERIQYAAMGVATLGMAAAVLV